MFLLTFKFKFTTAALLLLLPLLLLLLLLFKLLLLLLLPIIQLFIITFDDVDCIDDSVLPTETEFALAFSVFEHEPALCKSFSFTATFSTTLLDGSFVHELFVLLFTIRCL